MNLINFKKLLCLPLLLSVAFNACQAQHGIKLPAATITGAQQTAKYLPLLRGKRVAVLANQTAVIGHTHLVDSLQALGINVVKVFGPEHGFRGKASAGAKVADERDPKTGIPVISLYGPKNKPTPADLADVDIMVYDLQDVGVRFYTHINALARLMEACAENHKKLVILDRPNPNGYLVDGPVLDMKLKSGIGMFPLPMAHGLTIAEFAKMCNGEGWLANGEKCDITIIPVLNYRHDMPYTCPVAPSPNLNTQQSILLYPSLCMFEGTYINLGRGTLMPFTVLGSPYLKGKYAFNFTPASIKGMAETPLFMNRVCYGLDLRNYDTGKLRREGKINFGWLFELYKASPNKADFFNNKLSREMGDIAKLVGDANFRTQVEAGVPETVIRKSWEPGLAAYKKMRLKYLMYK